MNSGGGPSLVSSASGLPVSSRLFRLDRILGHPLSPPLRMSRGTSQECDSVIVSFTPSPDASMLYVTRHSGSSPKSCMPSTSHEQEKRRGGDQSTTSPVTCTRPSGQNRRKQPPCFGSASTAKPKKYCLLKAGSVSACQTFSGVAAM